MLQSPKLAILQSLEAMDKVQMEEVLLYIRSLLNHPEKSEDHRAFKKEAMKEIRKALRQEKRKLRIAA
jgi:hypothetical protein